MQNKKWNEEKDYMDLYWENPDDLQLVQNQVNWDLLKFKLTKESATLLPSLQIGEQ